VSWRKITTTKGSWVLSLAKDGNGTVFVGAFGDFGYLSPDTVGRLQFTSPLDRVEPADRDFAEVWRTHCTNNAVYFWTRNIIFRWSMNSFTAWRSDSAYALSSVFQDTLYVERRGSGLLKLVGDSLTAIADSKKLSPLGMIEMLPYDNRTPLVAFNVEGRNPVELAEALNDAGIESRAGCHCATLAHHSLGLTPPASCRLSFYFYNEMNDVESATSTLALIVRKNPIPRGLVA